MPPKKGRGDLLGGIQGFKKNALKHTETVDKSGPDLGGVKPKGGGGGGVPKGAPALPGRSAPSLPGRGPPMVPPAPVMPKAVGRGPPVPPAPPVAPPTLSASSSRPPPPRGPMKPMASQYVEAEEEEDEAPVRVTPTRAPPMPRGPIKPMVPARLQEYQDDESPPMPTRGPPPRGPALPASSPPTPPPRQSVEYEEEVAPIRATPPRGGPRAPPTPPRQSVEYEEDIPQARPTPPSRPPPPSMMSRSPVNGPGPRPPPGRPPTTSMGSVTGPVGANITLPGVLGALEWIMATGTSTPNIFFKNCDPELNDQVDMLVSMLRREDEYLRVFLESQTDLLVISTAIKRYLKKMSSPIIPFWVYDSIVETVKRLENSPDRDVIEAIGPVINQIAPDPFRLLGELFAVLHSISSCTPTQLAYGVNQVIMWPETLGPQTLNDQKYVNRICIIMIENPQAVFGNVMTLRPPSGGSRPPSGAKPPPPRATPTPPSRPTPPSPMNDSYDSARRGPPKPPSRPAVNSSSSGIQEQIDSLRADLQGAIDAMEFERCADLKNQISALEMQLGGGGGDPAPPKISRGPPAKPPSPVVPTRTVPPPPKAVPSIPTPPKPTASTRGPPPKPPTPVQYHAEEETVEENGEEEAGDEDTYAVYNRMKKMLPEGAVRQKMAGDGFSEEEIDAFFGSSSESAKRPTVSPLARPQPVPATTGRGPPPPVKAPPPKPDPPKIMPSKPVPTAAKPTPIPSAKVAPPAPTKSVALPKPVSVPSPTPARATISPDEDEEEEVEEEEEEEAGGGEDPYAIYEKMKKMLPEGAVRQKMATDGFSQEEIDDFFEWGVGGGSAPSGRGASGGGPPRGALLGDIQGFKKNQLKKTKTKDTSKPAIGKTAKGGGGGAPVGGIMGELSKKASQMKPKEEPKIGLKPGGGSGASSSGSAAAWNKKPNSGAGGVGVKDSIAPARKVSDSSTKSGPKVAGGVNSKVGGNVGGVKGSSPTSPADRKVVAAAWNKKK